MSTTTPSTSGLYGELAATIAERVLPAMEAIPPGRQRALDDLAAFVGGRAEAALIFICTHNSRRSHLAEQWAAVAAHCYGLDHVATHSGGTEATAVDPRTVAALERGGFEVTSPGGPNPRHEVRLGPALPPRVAYSKVFSDEPNPSAAFAAVMTCSDADRSCPIAPGAALRVALPYVDPSEADDTPAESSRYDERSQEIASEMFTLMARAAEARLQ